MKRLTITPRLFALLHCNYFKVMGKHWWWRVGSLWHQQEKCRPAAAQVGTSQPICKRKLCVNAIGSDKQSYLIKVSWAVTHLHIADSMIAMSEPQCENLHLVDVCVLYSLHIDKKYIKKIKMKRYLREQLTTSERLNLNNHLLNWKCFIYI